MDGTLVRGNTAADYVHSRWKRGLLSSRAAAEAFLVYGRYRLGLVDMTAVIHEAAREVQGLQEAELAAECRLIYHERVRPRICPDMRERVRHHRERGDAMAIVTASTPYIARHLAVDLAIDTVLATELEVQEGRFTGRIAGDPCFGHFKIDRVKTWAAMHHPQIPDEKSPLEQAFFYSDSDSDAPLLHLVGHPHVVRPDVRLRWRAWRHAWPQV